MKYIKLFEQFASSEIKPGDIAIAVISEGVDVSVFPSEIGKEIVKHLRSIKSDYYLPYTKVLNGDEKYVIIDSRVNLDVKFITQEQLDITIRKVPDMTVYQSNKEALSPGDNTDIYAVELLSDNKYMEIQSWGIDVKTGAYEHFMEYKSDEFTNESSRINEIRTRKPSKPITTERNSPEYQELIGMGWEENNYPGDRELRDKLGNITLIQPDDGIRRFSSEFQRPQFNIKHNGNINLLKRPNRSEEFFRPSENIGVIGGLKYLLDYYKNKLSGKR